MSKDKVVRTSYRRKPGFLEKLGNNAAGAAGGFALFLISFYILYSNEVSTGALSCFLVSSYSLLSKNIIARFSF